MPGAGGEGDARVTRWTRTAWFPGVFGVHAVLVQAITFVLRPTATYRAVELGVPTAWLGALAASFAVVPLLLAVPSGHAADRWGERRVMVAGSLLVVGAALVFTTVAGTVSGLVLACVLLGVGHLCSVVGQQALVANRSSAERYDAAFGHYTFATSLGQALGPGLIVALGGRATIPDTSSIFAWTLGLAVLLTALTLLLPSAPRGHGTRPDRLGGVRDLLRRPGLTHALIVSCVVLTAVDITLVYLPALGTDRNIAAAAVGALLTLRALASMVSRLFLGRLVAVLGRGRLLTGSITLSAVSMALLALPMPVVLMGVVVVLAGLGLGAGQPLTMAWLAQSTPAGLRGRAMSLRLTGNRLGQVVMPSLAGAVAVGSGAAGVLGFTAALLAGAGLVSHRLHRR